MANTKQTFSIIPLAGKEFALVEGTDTRGDDRQVQLYAGEFHELKGDSRVEEACIAFNDTVKDFFKPITEAKAKMREAQKTVIDEDFDIVVQEAVEGISAQPEVRRTLHTDTVILRLIEAGKTKRLRWTDHGIVVLAKK